VKYEIGNRIRKYREEAGISQKELAEKLNMSSGRVSNWEQGINRPDADRLAQICMILNVSPSLLLDVHIKDDDLNDKERKVINAYRCKKDMQKAVDKLLDLDNV